MEDTKKKSQKTIIKESPKIVRWNILVKTKTFIYKFVHIVKYPYRVLYTTHQKILSFNEEDASSLPPPNPYQVFFYWLFEIVGYGIAIAVPYNAIMGWQGMISNMVWIFAFGTIRWLFFNTITKIRRKE